MPVRRSALLATAGAAAVALAVLPATASAATATVSAPCYSHQYPSGSQTVVVTLTGGTPGGRFLLAAGYTGRGSGTAGSDSGTFDEAGNATVTFDSFSPRKSGIEPVKGEQVDFTLTEYNPGVQAVEVPVGSTLITNLAMDVSTKPLDPRKSRRITVSGAQLANQKLYGFIVRGKGSKVLKRISLGQSDGCGYATTKAVVAPRNYSTGEYSLYINAGPKLDKSKAIGSGFRITRYGV